MMTSGRAHQRVVNRATGNPETREIVAQRELRSVVEKARLGKVVLEEARNIAW